jgi:uncharacterized protein YjiK
MKSFPHLASLLSVTVLSANIACTESQAHSSPSEYDLKSPVIHKIDSKLAEISGVAFQPGDDNTIYAIEDERANFYRLSTTGEIQGKKDFGKKGDYEDLAITDSAAFVLRSDGSILRSDIRGDSDKVTSTIVENILPPGEYEGLTIGLNNTLIALCKDCKMKGSKGKLILFPIRIDEQNQLKASDPILVEITANKQGDSKTKLAPSGLARNPINGHWYIISSVNKLLIVLNAEFGSPQTFNLNPELFPQPEGICFDSKGTLFISNEAAGGSATILEYKRK